MRKMRIKKIITKFENIEEIAKKMGKIKNVKAVYLFGSYATRKQHALSDIDLCVIGNLTKEEESIVLGYSSDNLDVSIFYMLPIFIRFRVFKEGKPLIIKDEYFTKMLASKTLGEYLDFKMRIIDKHVMKTLGVKNE